MFIVVQHSLQDPLAARARGERLKQRRECSARHSRAAVLPKPGWCARDVSLGVRLGLGRADLRGRDSRRHEHQPLLRGRSDGRIRRGADGNLPATCRSRLILNAKGPACAGPFAFLSLKDEWPLGRPLRGGKNWGGLGTQVVVDPVAAILPLSGGIADPSEAVALLFERVGVVVVAVALPEPRSVVRRELDAAQPLCALPEVLARESPGEAGRRARA